MYNLSYVLSVNTYSGVSLAVAGVSEVELATSHHHHHQTALQKSAQTNLHHHPHPHHHHSLTVTRATDGGRAVLLIPEETRSPINSRGGPPQIHEEETSLSHTHEPVRSAPGYPLHTHTHTTL